MTPAEPLRREPVDVLIVEDSATQAEQLRYHLETSGYTVFAARNGREALARAVQRPPSLVVTDIVMPEMDGYDLCRAIKSQPQLSEIPVILVTSLSGPQDVLRGLESGADNFIRKPYEVKYLLSRIEYILANRELRKTERMQVGVQLLFAGQKYFITAEKQQILDLLISTYEGAIQINSELAAKQEELSRERDLLHTLMDNVPDWIQFKDTRGRITSINRAELQALGLTSEHEALGKTDFDFFAPAYARRTAADEERILRTGEPMIASVQEAQWPNGESLWLSTTKMPIRDLRGQVGGTFGVSRDVTAARRIEEQTLRAKEELEVRVAERTAELAQANTQLETELVERKRAQQIERETHERFRYLFANNPLPMWVYDLESTRFLEVNDASVAHYGYSREEFGTMCVADLLAEPDAAAAAPGATSADSLHRLKDGRTINVEIASHTLDWAGRDARLVVVHDVTERKRLQREFMLAQKMEAIGRMAAGVAHDFNNLLMVINGYSSMALTQMKEADPLLGNLREIHRAGERAAGLTRQLLAFSKRQVLQPQVVYLNQIVEDMERMLRRLIGEDVTLALQLDGTLGRIMADPGQMEQVVMNLAVNARDAMPQGGRLTIETSNVELRETAGYVQFRNLKPGKFVNLTMTDTGTGMDLETQSRIFDPFFTTKGEGGTGLGLSTVYGIVQQSGGAIVVYSEPGIGSSFKVYLPAVTEAAKPVAEVETEEAAGGAETILVVEDDESVRELICTILGAKGYTLLRAGNGEEAIRINSEFGGRISLVLTDLVMPTMSGRDLAAHLRETNPRLKVLLMSGYTSKSIGHGSGADAGIEFIGKPFEPRALLGKVRALLDSGDGPP